MPKFNAAPEAPLLGGARHGSAGRPACTGLPLGIVLVAIMITTLQAQNEMLRFQETNATLFVPVETIYMNHGWLVWNFFFAWVLHLCCSQDRRIVSPLAPVRRFWRNASLKWSPTGAMTRILSLELCQFLPNVAWTLVAKRVLPTLSIAVQQSSCVFVYAFALTPCLRSLAGGESLGDKCDSIDGHNNNAVKQTKGGRCGYLKAQWWSPALAIFACSAGVVIVCFGEAASGAAGDDAASNYVLLLMNPILMGLFDILFAKWTCEVCRDTEDVLVLMGMMGLATWVCCWPALFLDATPFQLPSPWSERGILLYGNAAMATCYNFSFMVGLNVMGPLFVSVGSVLQLPLSAITDLWLHGLAINVSVVIGGALIMFGFTLLSAIGGGHAPSTGDGKIL